MAATIDSIHDRAMTDLQALIQGLISDGSLPASSPSVPQGPQSVYVQMLPDESNIVFPCMLITCEGAAEEESEYSTFEEDGVVYPVAVGICDRVSMRYQEARPVYQAWRRTIMRAIRGLVSAPILPTCTEAVDVRLRPKMIFDPKAREYQFLVSGFTALVYTVEPRLRNVPT